jgi:hypothetical protein
MIWFEQWLEWWTWLMLSWHVLLKSAEGQIFGVHTAGQHVPLDVQYGIACLQIRNAIGCVSCSIEWGLASYFVIRLNHMVQKGPLMGNP